MHLFQNASKHCECEDQMNWRKGINEDRESEEQRIIDGEREDNLGVCGFKRQRQKQDDLLFFLPLTCT